MGSSSKNFLFSVKMKCVRVMVARCKGPTGKQDSVSNAHVVRHSCLKCTPSQANWMLNVSHISIDIFCPKRNECLDTVHAAYLHSKTSEFLCA